MTGVVPPWALLVARYGRSRGVWPLLLASLAWCAVAGWLLPRQIPELLSQEQWFRVPPVVGLIPVIAFGPTFARGISDAEWVHRGRLRACRGVHVIVVIAVLAGTAAAVTVGTPAREGWVSLLNGGALAGIGLLTVAFSELPPWTFSLALVASTYILGSDPLTGEPHTWAWLIWSDKEPLLAVIDLALLTAGVGAYLVRQGRTAAVGE